MKNGSLSSAGDVSMIPVGRARDASLSLKGFVWLLKFYPSAGKVYVYIDKTQMKVGKSLGYLWTTLNLNFIQSPDLFERAVDAQTEFDCTIVASF